MDGQSQGRRLSASPSPDGALAIYTPHKYSRSSRIHSTEVRILDLKTGNSTPFSKDPRDREPSWLGESSQVIWLKDVAFGATELWISDAEGSDIKYGGIHHDHRTLERRVDFGSAH